MTTSNTDCCCDACLVLAGGITGRVVYAVPRWTVIEDEHGQRMAVPTGCCEPLRLRCANANCPFAADLAA